MYLLIRSTEETIPTSTTSNAQLQKGNAHKRYPKDIKTVRQEQEVDEERYCDNDDFVQVSVKNGKDKEESFVVSLLSAHRPMEEVKGLR